MICVALCCPLYILFPLFFLFLILATMYIRPSFEIGIQWSLTVYNKWLIYDYMTIWLVSLSFKDDREYSWLSIYVCSWKRNSKAAHELTEDRDNSLVIRLLECMACSQINKIQPWYTWIESKAWSRDSRIMPRSKIPSTYNIGTAKSRPYDAMRTWYTGEIQWIKRVLPNPTCM